MICTANVTFMRVPKSTQRYQVFACMTVMLLDHSTCQCLAWYHCITAYSIAVIQRNRGYCCLIFQNLIFDRKLDIHSTLEMGSQAAVQLPTQVSEVVTSTGQLIYKVYWMRQEPLSLENCKVRNIPTQPISIGTSPDINWFPHSSPAVNSWILEGLK